MPLNRILAGALMGITIAGLVTAAGYGPVAALASAGQRAAQSITIVNDSFKPVTLAVSVGTKVTFTNNDDDPHTVTSVQPLFDSHALAQGDTFGYVFRKPGTYQYYCKVHPFMKGTIVVKETRS